MVGSAEIKQQHYYFWGCPNIGGTPLIRGDTPILGQTNPNEEDVGKYKKMSKSLNTKTCFAKRTFCLVQTGMTVATLTGSKILPANGLCARRTNKHTWTKMGVQSW